MNKFKKLSIPYLVWMIVFTGIPLILMVLFAVSNIRAFSIYTFKLSDFQFNFANFKVLFDGSFLKAFLRSMLYASIATLFALLLGYPIAYFISKSKFKNKYLLLLIFIMPMWTNMLLRIQTINNVLSDNSIVSNILDNIFGKENVFSGILNFIIQLCKPKEFRIVLVMTFVYLPFMIFPIYTVLEKIDKSIYEASNDLGAGAVKTFFKVTLPNTTKGIYSGIMMVFLPAAMGFTIPQIVTGQDPNYALVGSLIERQFKSSNVQYNTGSMWSLIIIIFVLGSLYIISKIDEDGETLL